MCRLAAYLGPPAPLSTLLYDGEHSLYHQAYQPREMLHATVNVDGTGVVWWPDDVPPGDAPLRYVTAQTPWADTNLVALAPRLRARLMIAAVRAASPGIPYGLGQVAPFAYEHLAFSHNGWLGGFRKGTGRELAERLPADLYGAMEAVSDSIVVFKTFIKHLRAGADNELRPALQATLDEVIEVMRRAGEAATLNLVVSDGDRIVASRLSFGERHNSLYVLSGSEHHPDALVLASEPLDDDPAWWPVPAGHTVTLTPEGAETTPLDLT